MDTRANGQVLTYIRDTCVTEPDWLARIHAAGETQRPGMQLSAYEGHVLCWLAQLVGAKKVLEIGTFMGYSALWMASGGARVTSLEFNAASADQARAHVASSPYASQVEVVQGDALAWLVAQAQQPQFDMVFIDAEKRSYVKYLEAALPLLQPRALVVGDNTLLWGAVYGAGDGRASKEAVAAMQQFNRLLCDPERFDGLMLPTTEGLTIGRLKA